MKNMKKLSARTLSLLLALVMCLGMLNLTAFADDNYDFVSDSDSAGFTGTIPTAEDAAYTIIHVYYENDSQNGHTLETITDKKAGDVVTQNDITQVPSYQNVNYIYTCTTFNNVTVAVNSDGTAHGNSFNYGNGVQRYTDSWSYTLAAGNSFSNVIVLRYDRTVNTTNDKPDAPTNEDVASRLGKVKVVCQPDVHADAEFGQWDWTNLINIGAVQGNDQDGYTCDVTFNAQKFCDAYNEHESAQEVTHTLVTGEGNKTVTLQWDACITEWVLPTDFTGPVTFMATCEKEPAPTQNGTWRLDIGKEISNYYNKGAAVTVSDLPADFKVTVTVAYHNGTERVTETKELTAANRTDTSNSSLVWTGAFNLPVWQYDFAKTGKTADDFADYNTVVTITESNYAIEGYACTVGSTDVKPVVNNVKTETVKVDQTGDRLSQQKFGIRNSYRANEVSYTVEWLDAVTGDTIKSGETRNGYTGNTVSVTDADKAVTGYAFQENDSRNVTGATLTADGAALKLYFKQQVTVTYKDAEGNTIGTPETKDKGTEFTINDAPTDVPDGKVFDGWRGSDGKTYQPGEQVTPNSDLTLTVVWADDKVGDPDGGPDGIADKYQVKVTFQVVNGLWGDGTAAEKSVWLTKFAADGVTYAENGTAKLNGAEFPAVTPALPFDGYKADGAWTNGDASVTATEQSITKDTVFVFTYAPKGTMTVEAQGYTGVYDGQWHEPIASLTIKDGEGNVIALNDSKLAISYDVEVEEIKDVQEQTIVITVKHADYATVTVNVVAKITPATLTAAYAGETVTVGGTPAGTVTVTGFVGGETAETAEGYVAPTVDLSNVSTAAAGTQTLTPANGAAKNYVFDYVSGTLTVNPQPDTPPVVIPPVASEPEPGTETPDEPPVEIDEPDVPLADEPVVDDPVVDIDEPDVPLAEEPVVDDPVVDIDEPDVPLADVPQTGDNSGIWTVLALVSGAGLVWLALEDKKRKAAAE